MNAGLPKDHLTSSPKCPLNFKLTYVKAEDTRSGVGKWLIAITCNRCHEVLVDYLNLEEQRP